jgi:hypothetical protein
VLYIIGAIVVIVVLKVLGLFCGSSGAAVLRSVCK